MARVAVFVYDKCFGGIYTSDDFIKIFHMVKKISKSIFQIYQGQINLISVKFHPIFHIEKELQVITFLLDISIADNS